MTTTDIKNKINELADMIRLLRNEMTIVIETGDDDQYIAAYGTRRLLRAGLDYLEKLLDTVELAEKILEA